MEIKIIKKDYDHFIALNNKEVIQIIGNKDYEDSFIKIDTYAYKWIRKTNSKVDHMSLEAYLLKEATFTMVPSISYNGNGWGTIPEYVGDRDEETGLPWTYAWHRSTIPSCTYSENDEVSFSLMANVNSNSACSLYKEDNKQKHVILFPEEEGPKTLQRHFWGPAFKGTMEPTDTFEAILLVVPSNGEKYRYKDLLDFAWRYYGHEIYPEYDVEKLYDLSIAYCRYLLEREQNGFIGFTMGSQWFKEDTAYHKTAHRYEIGWVGTSASMANAYIYNYIKNHNEDDLKTAIEIHDAWLKYGKLPKGMLASRIDYHWWRDREYPSDYVPDPWKLGEAEYESHLAYIKRKFRRDENGRIQLSVDACNLGTAAEQYFEAYDLLQSINIDKPEYKKAALDVCDFALDNQNEEGGYAKSWTEEGELLAKDGTVGCFLIIPIIEAYKKTNNPKYLDSAIKAFNFYYSALLRDGFTTAGALDTYSIDKESASPLLRDALALYDVLKEDKYIKAAEKIAWYLCTWMMTYTIEYPKDSVLGKMGYDTFGSTSVSTPHQALDQYALRDVLSFIQLSKLTNNKQWLERAKAFWCNACQCISDGTLYINDRLRPTGSQDEAIFHTRWSRRSVPQFMPSQWLPAWPCAFRLENIRHYKDINFFNEGLEEIEGKIK